MIGEEDHIRIQVIKGGFCLEEAYSIAEELESMLHSKLYFAFDNNLGYLTECPTNLGTGLRASVMLHLPLIESAGEIGTLSETVSKIGFTVRGMYGEGTKASGYIFQISNQKTLGIDEKEITDKLYDVANQVISKERELRALLLKQKGISLEDKIMRSCGILKNARLLSGKEMLTLFSEVRLGISLGLIADIDIKDLNTLMIETSPAHLLPDAETPEERDTTRAEAVRKNLNKEE